MESQTFAPETLEGWYVLHQLYAAKRHAPRKQDESKPDSLRSDALAAVAGLQPRSGEGWSMVVELVGSRADLMFVHFRPTLEALADAERRVKVLASGTQLPPEYHFLSLTEAGLYHLTATLVRDAAQRGGEPGDEQYKTTLATRVDRERENPHPRKRLYPDRPADMPYVCFYPMSKRRQTGQNWYTLSLDERSRLMHEHGMTGRRYAGRIFQVISGAIGFDAWEWGVTLFAKDPLDFQKLVSEMRFDEVSAKYAEFGEFFVGKVVEP